MIPDILAENEYYSKEMPDNLFGVDIFLKSDLKAGTVFRRHWHEEMQLYSFVSGNAYLDCAGHCFTAENGDIVVINSREPHFMQSSSDNLAFYIIRINLPFLFSRQIDLCQTKFITPLAENRITFTNLVTDDKCFSACVSKMIQEYNSRQLGYELAVKAAIYELITQLIRNHLCRIMTQRELTIKIESIRRFESTLDYINTHYAERIAVTFLAGQAHVTVPHFCRTFRELTGDTFTDYLNKFRLEKSVALLCGSRFTVTEIAIRSGFDSINYYSRLFKKYYHITPTEYRRQNNHASPRSLQK
jgi:AraC-like DNA-binding protein